MKIFHTSDNKMESTKRSLPIIFLDKKMVFIGFVVLGISFSVGVIIGYFGKDNATIGQDSVVGEYITDQFQKNKVNNLCTILLFGLMFVFYMCICINIPVP